MTRDDIAIGAYYKHLKSGGVYQVLMFATIESTMTEAVVYTARTRDGPRNLVVSVTEFCDGRFVPDDMVVRRRE